MTASRSFDQRLQCRRPSVRPKCKALGWSLDDPSVLFHSDDPSSLICFSKVHSTSVERGRDAVQGATGYGFDEKKLPRTG